MKKTRKIEMGEHRRETRKVSDLKRTANNPRKHSFEQIEQIASSIRKFGFTVPVVIDEKDQIIAGHGRFMAARVMGLDSIPVVVASGWSEEQKKTYLIADNKLAENSEWDKKPLKSLLTELSKGGADMELTGFDDSELKELILTDDDPMEGLGEPVEVTRIQCPTCGRLNRKPGE